VLIFVAFCVCVFPAMKLVANPSVIFLSVAQTRSALLVFLCACGFDAHLLSLCMFVPCSDEPTSGLDAPSAARVMKAVRRIAATGRTVLCTSQ
jgi:hypothetical protein